MSGGEFKKLLLRKIANRSGGIAFDFNDSYINPTLKPSYQLQGESLHRYTNQVRRMHELHTQLVVRPDMQVFLVDYFVPLLNTLQLAVLSEVDIMKALGVELKERYRYSQNNHILSELNRIDGFVDSWFMDKSEWGGGEKSLDGKVQDIQHFMNTKIVAASDDDDGNTNHHFCSPSNTLFVDFWPTYQYLHPLYFNKIDHNQDSLRRNKNDLYNFGDIAGMRDKRIFLAECASVFTTLDFQEAKDFIEQYEQDIENIEDRYFSRLESVLQPHRATPLDKYLYPNVFGTLAEMDARLVQFTTLQTEYTHFKKQLRAYKEFIGTLYRHFLRRRQEIAEALYDSLYARQDEIGYGLSALIPEIMEFTALPAAGDSHGVAPIQATHLHEHKAQEIVEALQQLIEIETTLVQEGIISQYEVDARRSYIIAAVEEEDADANMS